MKKKNYIGLLGILSGSLLLISEWFYPVEKPFVFAEIKGFFPLFSFVSTLLALLLVQMWNGKKR